MTKNKIKALLEKIKEVIKEDDINSRLMILILFCLRILILRLGQSTLNEVFRNIWPILLTLLVIDFLLKPRSRSSRPRQL